mmetsp:Transcript_6392/g.17058  ORF Transcript_6392/g.17058 Transcript_6392/m.17058 type:complete len:114 (+) Transcript_6392:272-613(+)
MHKLTLEFELMHLSIQSVNSGQEMCQVTSLHKLGSEDCVWPSISGGPGTAASFQIWRLHQHLIPVQSQPGLWDLCKIAQLQVGALLMQLPAQLLASIQLTHRCLTSDPAAPSG